MLAIEVTVLEKDCAKLPAHLWCKVNDRHLYFAIFHCALRAFCPWRVAVVLEVSPPPWRGFGVPFEALQKQSQVEHGISVFWIGMERALLTI
jgi:hypothetical protein